MILFFYRSTGERSGGDTRKGYTELDRLGLSLVVLVEQSWKNLSGIGRPQGKETARPEWVKNIWAGVLWS